MRINCLRNCAIQKRLDKLWSLAHTETAQTVDGQSHRRGFLF